MSDLPSLPFTVLTPTFNRAALLRRVFASLQAQTCQDFEWLVVDDGSIDDTAQVVQQLKGDASFPVRYLSQPNGHKKTAYNTGVAAAQGEWLLVLDDDDELTPTTLETLRSLWLDIPSDERHRYVGVTGLCARPDGSIVGDRFPQDVLDCTATELYFKHFVRGEKFGCQRTAVLRDFPYPQDVAGFVPESLVWWRIADAGFLNRFANRVVRVYHPTPASLSQAGTPQTHAAGLYILSWLTINTQLRYFRDHPKLFLMAAARVTRFRLSLHGAVKAAVVGRYPIDQPAARLLVALMSPLGALWFLRDRRRQRDTRHISPPA